MLDRVFPKEIDNHYRGHKLGLWLFIPITFMHVAISLVAIFTRDGGAQKADGIPLDTFGSGAAQAVIGVIAYLGLADLLFDLVCVLALIRYRAMIPLLYVMLVVDFVAHRGIGLMKPIVRAGVTGGSYVVLGLFAVSVLGLVLSLLGNGYSARRLPEAA